MVSDHLGTPQLLVDAAQQVVWSVNQSPFGEVTVNGNVEQPLRFPGQYADSETGYSYNYFRDYDPTLGRYIESDPIGLEAGVNTFGYVDGNPIRSLDLHGLYKDPDWTVWWKPMAFGTAAHNHVGQLFQARSGYAYNVDYNGMFKGGKPDIIDTNGLMLWEMKPISYRSGPGRILAVSQVTSYSKVSGFSLGNSTALLGGATMDAGMMLFDNSFYRITLYADSWLGDTGLFFYDAYKMNKQEVIDFYAAVDNDARSLSGSGAYCPVF